MLFIKYKFKGLLLSFTLVFALFSSGFSTTYVTIKNGNHNDNSVWSPSKPSFGWGNVNDTIIIKHEVKLKSNLNTLVGHLVIDQGASLYGNKQITLAYKGAIRNNGLLSIKKLYMEWGSPSVTNNDSIYLSNDFIINEGTVSNNGSMNIKYDLENKWGGTFENKGRLDIGGMLLNDNEFVNTSTVNVNKITNKDSFENSGDVTVTNSFLNDWGSAYTSTGPLNVGTDLTNKGSLTQSGSTFIGDDFKSDWNTNTSFSGSVDVGDKFTAQGTTSSTASLSVGGDVKIDWGVSFINSGDLITDGDFKSNGNVTNDGHLNIKGDMEVDGSLVNSNYIAVEGNAKTKSGSSVQNYGEVYVVNDFTNNGDFENDGYFLVDGDLDAAGGSVTGNGDLCSTDGTNPVLGGSSKGSVDCNICSDSGGSYPVELLSFTGKEGEHGVVLEWLTATELNNDYFILEVAREGQSFENLSLIQGNGNSDKEILYNFVDSDVKSGLNVYRLSQVDFDGTIEVIGIVEVNYDASNLQAKVYPNPVRGGDMLTIQANQRVDIAVYNGQGRLVKEMLSQEGSVQIATDNLSRGFYIIKIISGDKVVTKKVHIL